MHNCDPTLMQEYFLFDGSFEGKLYDGVNLLLLLLDKWGSAEVALLRMYQEAADHNISIEWCNVQWVSLLCTSQYLSIRVTRIARTSLCKTS